MFEWLSEQFKPFTERKTSRLSIPVFDGVFKPNNLLETAETLLERPGLEDMAVGKTGDLFAACGGEVLKIAPNGDTTQLHTFSNRITALALSPDGSLAIALGDRIVIGAGTNAEIVVKKVGGVDFVSVNALSFAPQGHLLATEGSDRFPTSQWSHDLMSKGRTGRLIKIDPHTGQAEVIASNLAYAFGAHDTANGETLISQSWAHSLSRLTRDGQTVLIDDLPGYPCRFAAAGDGGFWLTLFCSRTSLWNSC